MNEAPPVRLEELAPTCRRLEPFSRPQKCSEQMMGNPKVGLPEAASQKEARDAAATNRRDLRYVCCLANSVHARDDLGVFFNDSC